MSFLHGSGLNHDHLVLGQSGWLARIPRGNNNPDSDAYLKQQEAIYRAAAASKHTPELLTALAPMEDLPHGVLIVRRIENARKADFGRDYLAIAKCLASINTTAPPLSLKAAETPGASQREFIEAMLVPSLDSSRLKARTRLLLESALEQCDDDLARMSHFPALPTRFVATDAHPANFLIDRQNKAWFVDLEYAAVDCLLVDSAMAACPLARQLNPESNPSAPQGTEQKFFDAWLSDVSRDGLSCRPPSAGRHAARHATRGADGIARLAGLLAEGRP